LMKRSKHSSLSQSKLTAKNTASLGYMPGLDGLRALAVLAVIGYHLNLSWVPGGLLGVCLFFVLSGYLITNILLNQWEESQSLNLKDFWLRRIRRLLPALLLMLVGVLLWAILFAPDRLTSLGQEAVAALFYANNWQQILQQVSYFESFGPPSPLGHLWSLAVEGQFYLLWPLLLGWGLRYFSRRRWIIGGTVALALASAVGMAYLYIPGLDPSRVYYGTDTRAFALLIGAVLALLWPSGKLSPNLTGFKRWILDGVGVLGLVIVLWMFLETNEYQPFLYQGGLLLFSLAAAVMVIVLAHPASRLGKIFSLKPLRWLGACSYGIYLWHYPIIVLTSPPVNTGGPNIFLMLAQIGASVILAALSFYLVEEPIRRGKGSALTARLKISGWWRKPAVIGGKITLLSMVMVLGIFCFTVYGSMLISQDQDRQTNPWEETVKIGADKEIPGQENSEMEESMDEAMNPSEEMLNSEPNSKVDPGVEPETESESGSGSENATESGSEAEKKPGAGSISDPQTDSGEKSGTDPAQELTGKGITIIGDSVMLNIKPILEEHLPGIVIDAKVGRQMHEASGLIKELRALDKLGKIVIIELGTNGPFTAEQLTKTLDALEGVEQIVLVNVRVPKPWQNVVNETLAKVAATYPNTSLIDWHGASSGHDEYFYQDGVHLKPAGADAYAQLIIQGISPLGLKEEHQDDIVNFEMENSDAREQDKSIGG
jgi:peptidoglycan/LPS O-acetylase OafA/YrhL